MGDNWYSDRRQDHVKLSPLGKCPIKWTDLLVVTIVTIINVVNDLTWITLQWNSSWRMASLSSNPVISWVLSSYFCLSYFDLLILVTTLVSSNFSYGRNMFLYLAKIEDQDILHSCEKFCIFYPHFTVLQSGTDIISHTYVRYLLSSIWTRVRTY